MDLFYVLFILVDLFNSKISIFAKIMLFFIFSLLVSIPIYYYYKYTKKIENTTTRPNATQSNITQPNETKITIAL